jgi:uncharacterized membrane protein YjgN (DUF898 family)
VTTSGVSTLRFDGGFLTPLSFLASLVAWMVALAVLFRFGLAVPWQAVRRRRWRARRRTDGDGAEDPQAEPESDGIREGADAGVVV